MFVITTLNAIVVLLAYFARLENLRCLLACAFVLLSLVLGIRYGYGNDYFNYYDVYQNSFGKWDESQELGWFFLNRLFHPVGFEGMVFFLTFIEHIMLYDLIRRHIPHDYYWLAVFIYVFNSDYMLIGLSMMRQFLVQIIGLYAVEFAVKKRIFPFLLLVLIGIMIHKIALLILPLYFLSFIKDSKWWMLTIAMVLLGVIALNMNLIIELSVEAFQETEFKYADSYLNENVLSEEHTLGMRYIYHYVIYIIVFIRNFKYISSNDRVFAWMVVWGLFFLPFAYIFPMATRTSWIYTIAEILVYPVLLSKERVPVIKYGIPSLLVFFTLWLDYRSIFLSDIYSKYFSEFRTVFSII